MFYLIKFYHLTILMCHPASIIWHFLIRSLEDLVMPISDVRLKRKIFHRYEQELIFQEYNLEAKKVSCILRKSQTNEVEAGILCSLL